MAQGGNAAHFHCASASIRGSRNEIVPASKNDPDAFQDARTGEWFKEREVKGAAGQSYLEVLVSDMADGKVLLQTKDLLIVPSGLDPTMYGAAVARPGNGLEYWVNADFLNARLRDPIDTPALRILHINFPLGNKNYDAIRIQGKQGASIYDLKSGVLLWESMSAQGARLKYYLVGEGPREGSKSIGYCRFVTSREVSFPWADQKAPDWVANLRELRFKGEHTDVIPGAYTVPIGESAVFGVTDRGSGWVRTTATVEFARIGLGPPLPSATTDGISSRGGAPGGVYLPPAGLSQLRPGQQLDSDLITKATISVAGIRNQGNRQTVIFIEAAPGYRTTYGYDRESGMLNSMLIERAVGSNTARDSLSLVSWR